MPKIHNGKRIRDIKKAILRLHKVAMKLRTKRISNGALRIDIPKMKFDVMKASETEPSTSAFEAVYLQPNQSNHCIKNWQKNCDGSIREEILFDYFEEHGGTDKKTSNTTLPTCEKEKASEIWFPRGLHIYKIQKIM